MTLGDAIGAALLRAEESALVTAMRTTHGTYRGWRFAWEYPGNGCYSHPDREVMVWATPDWNRHGWISIQITDKGGEAIRDAAYQDGCEVPFPIRTANAWFLAVKPWLDRHSEEVASGPDECAECGARFTATEDDHEPFCPRCR